jgi:hypothetical protein
MPHSPITPHISAIQALCEEIGITRLELCEGDTSSPDATTSPTCFIVTTPATENPGLWAEKLVELEERLSSLLGREIDLLLPGALRNDWVRTHLARSRTEVYTVGQ